MPKKTHEMKNTICLLSAFFFPCYIPLILCRLNLQKINHYQKSFKLKVDLSYLTHA